MIKFFRKLGRFIWRETKYALWFFAAYFPFLPTIMFKYIRPAIWKWIGVKIGKNTFIGFGVYLDVDGVKRLSIGNDVIITSHCLLLMHKRDLKSYKRNVKQRKLPYIQASIIIEDNVSLGMRTIVMPGVNIGEGAVVGAGSLVSRDVPSYTVVAGNPIKVIREIDQLANQT